MKVMRTLAESRFFCLDENDSVQFHGIWKLFVEQKINKTELMMYLLVEAGDHDGKGFFITNEELTKLLHCIPNWTVLRMTNLVKKGLLKRKFVNNQRLLSCVPPK